MYSFFSNNTKRKAFARALKEIEASGVYVDYRAEENAATLLPDISAKVAELSGASDKKPIQEPTLDLTSITAEEVSQAPRTQLKPEPIITQTATREPVSFDSLFASRSFLSSDGDKDYDDLEFLTTNRKIYDEEPTAQAEMQQGTATIREKSEEDKPAHAPRKSFNQRVMEELARNKEEQEKQDKLLAEQQELRQKAQREEQLRLEAEEQLKQSEQKAKAEKEENQRALEELRKQQLAAEQEAAAKAAALAAATAKKPAKPKSTTPRKRKRRYDADIIGGFDF